MRRMRLPWLPAPCDGWVSASAAVVLVWRPSRTSWAAPPEGPVAYTSEPEEAPPHRNADLLVPDPQHSSLRGLVAHQHVSVDLAQTLSLEIGQDRARAMRVDLPAAIGSDGIREGDFCLAGTESHEGAALGRHHHPGDVRN